MEAGAVGAVRNLIVSVEAYPDLKSNTNFLELQQQLAETEDRIANGRRYYNANVRVYNTKVESVPTNIIANMFQFEKATYFEVNDPAVRQAPNVSFGEIAYRGDQQQAPAPSQGQLPQQGAPGYDDLPNPQQQYAPPPQQYGQPPDTQDAPQQYAPQQGQQTAVPAAAAATHRRRGSSPSISSRPQHSAPPQHYAPPQHQSPAQPAGPVPSTAPQPVAPTSRRTGRSRRRSRAISRARRRRDRSRQPRWLPAAQHPVTETAA